MSTPNSASVKANLQSDDLAQQIEALKADVSKLMATVSDDVSEGLGEAGRQISRTSRDARVTATNSVIDHPMAAVGIAVGVGLLLGLVARKG
jgi:ElaB/YqjD/DUF883 family membrane-anchored ribosome-binding protein